MQAEIAQVELDKDLFQRNFMKTRIALWQASERKLVVVLDDLFTIALFNGCEIDGRRGWYSGLVIEILGDILCNLFADCNATGVVAKLCVNLIIGLGVSIVLFPGSVLIEQDQFAWSNRTVEL
ncbi:MAG: hypothetical protein NT075_27940 [Chloroflexi bacterium]|nr:hypothetical protein [Chloroflexota bacterium]